MKRIVALGDLHCGHVVGLCPPSYHVRPEAKKIQAELWRHYTRTLDALQPIDAVIANGDLIDGRGEKSGGTELIEPDVLKQAEMATHCLQYARAKSYFIAFGTRYHTGQIADYEKLVASDLDADIRGHGWIDCNGVVFDYRHKIGSSSVPYGRLTPLARAEVWRKLWAQRKYAHGGRLTFIIRSHVHSYNVAGGPDWMGFTLPALQGPGSTFGERECDGIVDFGLMSFDISDAGEVQWKAHLWELSAGRPPLHRV